MPMNLRRRQKGAIHSGATTGWAKRSLSHAFVGIWEAVANRFHTTTVRPEPLNHARDRTVGVFRQSADGDI